MTYLYNLYSKREYIKQNRVASIFDREKLSLVKFNSKKYITDFNTEKLIEFGNISEYNCYLRE